MLGSGAVFLESSVVNVALPAIARDFHVVAFAIASGGCALAPSLFALVALRVVQGAAGELLVPVRNEGGARAGKARGH